MGWYFKCCCLEDACKKIFRITRMFAMFPLNDNCQISLKISLTSAIVFFTLGVHCICWIYRGEKFYFTHRTFFHTFLYISRRLILTSSCILIAIHLVLKRDKLRLILDNLKKIDSELGIVDKGPMVALCPINYLFNIFISIFVVTIQSFTNEPVFWMEGNIDIVLVAIIINQIFAFCELFKYSLEQISTFPCFVKYKDYTLRTRLYNLIEECTENLNDIYGLGMFFIITTLFISIVHQLYQYPCRAIVIRIEHMLSIYFTAACNFWLVLQLILACSMVSSKARIFNNTLYNQLIKNGCKNISYHEEIYYHFERVKKIRITANGFFIVDHDLIGSMIITGTTYLVIFMQYCN
ncbi:Gustatory receptor 124 [Halyomorpha halys]|nr:Gustatory receptor 124 [Halyomorpha halys]